MAMPRDAGLRMSSASLVLLPHPHPSSSSLIRNHFGSSWLQERVPSWLQAPRKMAPVRVITLHREPAKLQSVAAHMDGLAVPWARWPGVLVDAAAHERAVAEGLLAACPGVEQAGKMGCALEHLTLWRAVAAGDDAHVLVLEDDEFLAPAGLAALPGLLAALEEQGGLDVLLLNALRPVGVECGVPGLRRVTPVPGVLRHYRGEEPPEERCETCGAPALHWAPPEWDRLRWCPAHRPEGGWQAATRISVPGAVKMPNVWLGAYLLSREGAARLLAALQEARYTGNEHIDWALSRDVLLRPDVRAFVAAQTNHFSVKVDGDDARQQLDREGTESYGSKRLRSRR